MTSQSAVHGIHFCATLTPFRPGTDEIDLDAYRGQLRRLAEKSSEDVQLGVIAVPEAGEIFALDRDEKRAVIDAAMEEVGGRLPVFAGISENTTSAAAKAAAEAASQGVDGLFVMSAIGGIDVAGSWDAARYPEVYSDMVREIVGGAPDLPVIAHAVGRSTPDFGIGLPADAVEAICREVENIVGWKMIYPYAAYRRVRRTLPALPRPVSALAASGGGYQEYLASGYLDGSATGSLNFALDPMVDHIAAWKAGDLERAREIWHGGLLALHEYVASEYSRLHVRYKVAAWLMGLVASPHMRRPMPDPRRVEVDTLARLLAATGMELIEKDRIDAYTRDLRA